jgi:hypothetical protein
MELAHKQLFLGGKWVTTGWQMGGNIYHARFITDSFNG